MALEISGGATTTDVAAVGTEVNKIDIAAAVTLVPNSLSARLAAIQSAVGALGAVAHVPLFSGGIYYVDAAQADDTGVGTSPETAKRTIGAAIGVASAGDAITVKAGTYTDVGLDLNLNAMELWCEIGVFIAPASGTALVLSGNSCQVRGVLWVLAVAGQLGVSVTGDYCNVRDMVVIGGTNGFDVSGTGNFLFDCRAGQQTVAAYDIRGARGVYEKCNTVGLGGATYGFYINGSADTGVLLDCTSTGHGTSGYYVDTGSQDWTIKGCASGAGDGPRRDIDDANVWSNYTFDDEVFHVTTFAGGGGGADNLFQVTGAVEVEFIYGDVYTVLSADVDDIYLDLWDGTVSVEITDNLGGGTDTNSADVGSIFIKNEIATTKITLMQNNQGRIEENTDSKKPHVPFIALQKKDTNTYIRVVYDGVATSGVIHWHCRWELLTEDGWLEAI